jgi:8-oxo-dGTP pyrophosphatase MutT (NUDIX family)
MSEREAVASVRRVSRLDLAYRPWVWPFALERRAEIDAHFARAQAAKPQLWNGQVLLARNPHLDGEDLSAAYFQTDFASFLAWRDWGAAGLVSPDPDVFNCFGMGALRGSDGVFVLGEMAAHTANAGRIYFPSGTPDPDDRRGERVDIAGSVVREVMEETGLAPSDYRTAEHWHCVRFRQSIGLMRSLDADESGAALQVRIMNNLALQTEPELSAIHLVRDARDFASAMPVFVTAYIEAVIAGQ